MDKCISQFREVTNVNGNEYLLLAYPNIRNVKIKIENIANFISKVFKEGDSSFVFDAPTDGILYGRKDKKWEQITFPDVTIYLKKDDAKLLYQPIGNYLTEIPEEYITETELNNKGYLTEHQDISGKLDISVYNVDKETFALKVELPDVSNFITKSVSDLENYYRKNETYTQTQVKDLINSITTINFEVVDNLPEQDQKENIIYLVPSSKTEEQNVKDEYIWINNNWELIGSTKIDLSSYALKDEIPTKVSQLTNDSGYITTIPDDYITNTELENKGYATINTDKETFALKSDIPDVSGFITSTIADATYQPIGDYITEIKTINGQSLVGSGNIEIQGNGGGIADAPSDGETYGRNNGNWVKVEAKAVNVYDLIMRVHQAAAAQTKVAQEDYNTLFGYLENGTSLYMYEGGNSIAIELTLDSDKMIIIFKTPISIAGQDCACFYISNSTLDVTLLSITFVNKDYIASTVLLKEYSKAKTYTPIIAEDTINSAIGKLEAGIGSGGVGKVDPNSDGTGLIFNDYENNVATGSYATAIGYKTQASGKASFAGGNASYRSDVIRAKGNSSIAIGSTSMGSITAQGSASIAMGYAGGQGNIITNGAASIAIGCVSTGADIESSGSGSVAIGYADYDRSLIASGRASSAFGVNTSSRQFAQMAIGSNNIEETSNDSFSLTNKAFIIGNGGQSPDAAKSNAFYVKFNGETHADGAYSSSGADYAEMFEWKDANPTDEDRVGRFVTFDGDKIRLANANDTYILGIISGTPTIVGDDPIRWQGKYLNDEWGRPIYEDVEVTYKEFEKQEDGTEIEVEKTRIDRVRKINPNFNPEEKYIPRSERQEWDFVGMMGKLLVKQDGTLIAGGFCKSIEGGIATKSENGYYVMKVINENQALVLFK